MYIVVNIGCIECGVSSAIVGVFHAQIDADNIANALQASHGLREGGQNAFEVFELPTAEDGIAAEYRS